MDRKTIGGFLAALRKANGMTQKDLAQKLNVSDKTISRWERDDGTPDLSLIPVIAEIFQVSCDELLRGERKSPEERLEPPPSYEISEKGEKQRQRLLAVSLSRYRNFTYISMGLSVVGLIAALIGNLAFLRATLGFLMGCIFYAASIVCQAIFLNNAFLGISDPAPGNEQSLHRFKRAVILLAEYSFGLTTAFIGFTFPLILVDAYVGLGPDNLLIFGGIGAFVFLTAYCMVCYFLNAALLKRGIYTLEERTAQIYWHNHQLKRSIAKRLLLVVFVTAMMQTALNSSGLTPFMKGTVFTNYEDFTAYMEQNIPFDAYYFESSQSIAAQPVGENAAYFDQYGNEISEEEALRETLTDINGEVVCEYLRRNELVASIRYSKKEGDILPITVFTHWDYDLARARKNRADLVFLCLYSLELAGAVVVYSKKRFK